MKQNIFSFVEYIFLAPDHGFCCWITGGGVQNVSANILIFIAIGPNIVTQCSKSLAWNTTLTKWIIKHGATNPGND